MQIPAAMADWAAQNYQQLSTDTRAEVDLITNELAHSDARHVSISEWGPPHETSLREIFGPERAERARMLINVVAEWSAQQQTEAQQQPLQQQPQHRPKPTLRVVPDAVSPDAPSPDPVSPDAPSPDAASPDAASPDPVSPDAPDLGAPIAAPTFLGSDRVDADDEARMYGPQERSNRMVVAGGALACIVVALIGLAAFLMTRDSSDTADARAPVGQTADAVDTAAQTLPLDTSAAPAPTEVPTPAPTPTVPPVVGSWADIATILNAGLAEVQASTYNVSSENRAVLTGHTAAITGIAVSDDGRVLTSGADKRLVDWGRDITVANPDVLDVDATLTALIRTSDQRLIAGDGLGNVTVIDLIAGGDPLVIPVHGEAISAVAEVGVNTLAVASVDGPVHAFSIDDPATVRVLDHSVEVTALHRLEDGRLATAAVDGVVRLWPSNSSAADQPEAIGTHGAALTAMIPLSDGRLATADVNGAIHVVGAESNASAEVVLQGPAAPIRALLQLDDTTLVSGGDDATLRLWNLKSQAQERVLDGHGDLISSIAALPDGRLVSTSADGTGRVWDLSVPPSANVEPPHLLNVSDIAPWSNDEFVTGGIDGRVVLASTNDSTEPRLLTQHATPVVGVALTDVGDVVSLDASSELRLTDLGTGDVASVSVAPGATALSAWEGGIVSGHADGTVRFHDLVSESRRFDAHTSGVNDVIELSNGLVLSAGQDKTVRVIDVSNESDLLPVFDLHTSPVDVVAELPNGRIASAGSDGIYVWSTQELSRDHIRLSGHRGTITGLLGLSGNRLLSTATDGRVRLWDLSDPDLEPSTLLDIPGVINPHLIVAENGIFVAGAGRGYVTFTFS